MARLGRATCIERRAAYGSKADLCQAAARRVYPECGHGMNPHASGRERDQEVDSRARGRMLEGEPERAESAEAEGLQTQEAHEPDPMARSPRQERAARHAQNEAGERGCRMR